MANVQSFERADFFQQVKADLHRKILDRLDLEKLGKASGDSARDEVLVVIRNAVNMPAISPDQYKRLRPYLELGERLGAFAAQAAPTKSFSRIRIRYAQCLN